MKIYYDHVTEEWHQIHQETVVTFGGERKPLLFQRKDFSLLLSLDLNLKNGHVGPVIGIMTARKKDGTITGNSTLFMEIQEKLLSYGGFSFIFTPEDAEDDSIIGYTFILAESCWKKIKIPYPDLVYNRIPFRKEEQSIFFLNFISRLKEKKISFFNPHFLDKYELYCLFKNNSKLQSLIPETELISDKQSFFAFFERHKAVYLKPSRSAKGKGIFRLKAAGSGEIELNGLKRSDAYSSIQAFWEEWEEELIEKNYLVQEEKKSFQYEGKRCDFRILAQAEKDRYLITGIGIRQAQAQDLTTHVPHGGALLPYHLFQNEEMDHFFEMMVSEIGKTLTEHYGFFGEFSIDAGLSPNGDYYLYEVNSKPMSFDEKEIEEKKIAQLCRLFLQMTKFFPHEKEAFLGK